MFTFGLKFKMMSIQKYILTIVLCAVVFAAYGQSDILLTQQWFSRINMNPAATGNSNHVDIFLLNRQQWMGFTNAPRTSVLNAHSYFNAIQSGLGVSLLFDKVGVSRQMINALFSYAYHIDLTEEALLSMGLSGGLFNTSWDPRRNTMSEDNDPVLNINRSSRTFADFNAGMELNMYGLTFGASITHLLNSQGFTGKPRREYYSYVRYRIAIDKKFDVAPAIMYRNGNYSNFFDFNVTGYYLKKYWVGFSIRPKNTFSMMLGGEYNMFRIGYAYDRSIGVTSSLATNSHEIMLSVRLQKPQKDRKTTRFLD